MMPGQKHSRTNGKRYNLRNIPPVKIEEDTESSIERQNRLIDNFRATASIVGKNKTPDRPAINPNEKPETPFSVSKTCQKSNTQLIQDLASAAALDPRTVSSVSAQTTWWDGIGDAKRPCFMRVGPEWSVRGGRLGRDHTLEDVPNHFARDCLMSYINDQLSEDLRHAARKAVFTDLSDAELEKYSALIKKRKEEREIEEGYRPGPETIRERTASKIETSIDYKSLQAAREAKNSKAQGDALDAIDESVDLTPHPNLGFRNFDSEPTYRSVIKPDSLQLPAECEIKVDRSIDRDCDQIRSMVKIFIRDGEWTADQFRRALGGIQRPQFTSFLEKRGPSNGTRSMLFQLCWEFFHRREKLGLPLKGAGASDIATLQQQHLRKRGRVPGESELPGGKRTKKVAVGRA